MSALRPDVAAMPEVPAPQRLRVQEVDGAPAVTFELPGERLVVVWTPERARAFAGTVERAAAIAEAVAAGARGYPAGFWS